MWTFIIASLIINYACDIVVLLNINKYYVYDNFENQDQKSPWG